MNWKLWLKGLASAVIGGAAATVAQTVSDPEHMASGHYGNLSGAAIGGAVIGLLGYFMKSPLDPQLPLPPAAQPPVVIGPAK